MITPEELVKRGFKFQSAGRAGGADMWLGLPFWTHKSSNVVLRGFVSTARGGSLHLYPYLNTNIDTLEKLDNLLTILL